MAMPNASLALFDGVIPAKAGISVALLSEAATSNRDSRLRGNDVGFDCKGWGLRNK